MSTLSLSDATLENGVWTATVSGVKTGAPGIAITLNGIPQDGVDLSKGSAKGQWSIRFSVPAAALSDGVQTFVVTEPFSGDQIGHFTVIAGDIDTADIRAELDLLRAELDTLKRAFRRHCAETS